MLFMHNKKDSAYDPHPDALPAYITINDTAYCLTSYHILQGKVGERGEQYVVAQFGVLLFIAM